jgi:hypothetical protein
VKEILSRELGFKEFSRIWVSHWLSNDQKKLPVDAIWKLFSLVGMYAEHDFEGIATGDEF